MREKILSFTFNTKKYNVLIHVLICMILLIYAERHVFFGVDLMDQGYNLVNFKNFNPEFTDPMWFFSTYLAGALGHLIVSIPVVGDSLLFMNIITALIPAAMAIISYWFFACHLKINRLMVALGEVLALSLCWLPAEALYTYLSYLFILVACILIYMALEKENDKLMVAAGAVLGSSIFVKVPNVIYAALIIPVVIYSFMKRRSLEKTFTTAFYAFLGYFGAVVLFIFYFAVRYGGNAYFDGIMNLYFMGENAVDYKSDYILGTFIKELKDISHFFKRILIFYLAGLVPAILLKFKKNKILTIVSNVLWAIGAILVFLWLANHDYYGKMPISMRAVYRPAVLFIVVSCMLSFSLLFSKKVADNKKLVYIICIMLSLLPAFGSNNAFYSVINFMFFMMPVFFYEIADLIGNKNELTMPGKYVMGLLLLILLFRAIPFGINYIYEDAGSNGISGTVVTGVPALKGIKTTEDRSACLTEGYEIIKDTDYIVTFGNVPGLSYYYGKEALFNPWNDLRSVRMSVMTDDLHKLEDYVNEGKPVSICIGARYIPFFTGTGEVSFDDEFTKEKALNLKETMDACGFKYAGENSLFGIFMTGQ